MSVRKVAFVTVPLLVGVMVSCGDEGSSSESQATPTKIIASPKSDDFLAACDNIPIPINGLNYCWEYSKNAIEGEGKTKDNPKLGCEAIKGTFLEKKACPSKDSYNYKCDSKEKMGVVIYYKVDATFRGYAEGFDGFKLGCEGAPYSGKWEDAKRLPLNPRPLSGVVSVKGSCVLLSTGGVKCWNPDETDKKLRITPLNLTGLSSGVTALYKSGSYTCALLSTGGVKCWGNNENPSDVTGLSSGVTALYMGGNHSCALLSTGGVKCWGYNNYGQLGDGSKTTRTTPVDVTGLSSRVTALSTGDSYTCALLSTGGIKCWGDNNYGQLGDGSQIGRTTPVDVIGLSSGVTAINIETNKNGYSGTCAVKTGGGVKCWGITSIGGLGEYYNISDYKEEYSPKSLLTF